MSRGQLGRGRPAEKTKPPTIVPTPTTTHDIVAGKFNENDWNNMLEKDSAEEFCLDIVDELANKVLSAIYQKYLEHQLLPFTITQAKNALTEIIEWQFLSRDGGEKDGEIDPNWTQDEEPEPGITDCWAQGSVPKNYIPPLTPLVVIPEEEPEVVEEVSSSPVPQIVVKDVVEVPDFVSETEDDDVGPIQCTKEEVPTIKESRSSESSVKRKFRPYRGKLKPAKVGQMTESLEESEMKLYYSQENIEIEKQPTASLTMPASCASLLKAQNGRPPGNKDVTYDEMGNVIAVVKLDAEKLPTHKISVKYHVVDPTLESKLEIVKKISSKVKINHSVKSSTEHLLKVSNKSKHRSPGSVTPLSPGLIEQMELSRGVVLKEGGRVKKGPGLLYRKFDLLEENQKGLKQINLRIANPEFTVNDLLDRVTPNLRPFGESPPLPPIVPHPPPQRSQYSI